MSRIVKDDARGARIIDGAVYDAKAEATSIVAEARIEAQRIREQAWKEGHAEGRAEVAALLVRGRRAQQERVEASNVQIRTLAVRIAERLVRRELSIDPAVVVDMVKAALAQARGRHDFVLRVHPDDVALLDAERPGLFARLSCAAHILIRADESIARGGCVVDSDIGTVDARLETQLAAIEYALAEVMV